MVVGTILGSTWAAVAGIVLVVGVLTALLKTVIVPGAKGITTFNEDIAPNVKYMPLLAQLGPMLAAVEDIAKQGSTQRDTMDRLEKHGQENKRAAEEARATAVEFARLNRESITALEVAMGTVRELAKEDRQLAREDRDLARDAYQGMLSLAESAARTEESGARTEASGARVEAASAVVAEDLAATQKRADDVHADEPPGTASDAASQSPEDPDGLR